MPDHQTETTNFLVKAIMYVIGILLGLGTKLAKLNKEQPLTVKDFILHGLVAFACAWLVWALLEHYDHLDLANIASVIVGRYGDNILILLWKGIRNVIISFTKTTPGK